MKVLGSILSIAFNNNSPVKNESNQKCTSIIHRHYFTHFSVCSHLPIPCLIVILHIVTRKLAEIPVNLSCSIPAHLVYGFSLLLSPDFIYSRPHDQEFIEIWNEALNIKPFQPDGSGIIIYSFTISSRKSGQFPVSKNQQAEWPQMALTKLSGTEALQPLSLATELQSQPQRFRGRESSLRGNYQCL